MNRSISCVTLGVAALAALCSATAFAQSAHVSNRGFPLDGRAPMNYVSPQDRVKAAADGLVVADGQVKLPAGMHPNSLGAQSFKAKAEREAGVVCKLKNCVPVVGRTADNKYPVYGLQGELDDLNYISKQANVVYQPNDLIGRMGYGAEADVKAGAIKCDQICKNPAGQIVGLNPVLRKFEPAGKK